MFVSRVLVAAVAAAWALAADAATFFLSAALLKFARPRATSRALPATEAPTNILAELRSGWRTEFSFLRWM
ncbi:hypothetical protein [Streptomyces sp. NPDC127033]|uniref:hypothetical protein n=1 Tax=Streptomyces sp. NPDC127033 TaxID=3347110 RepID=UPI003649B6BE